MISRLLLPALLAAGLLAGCSTTTEIPRETPPPVAPAPPPSGFLIAGYHTYWTGDAWQTYDYATLDHLLFFGLDLAPDGTLADRHGWPDAWSRLLRRVEAERACAVPVVTLFDHAAFVQLFGAEAARETLRQTLLGLLADVPSACGLQLDIEIFQPVPPETRAALTAFVADLRQAMDALRPGLSLSMFAPAFDAADAFDEAALARSVNYFVVQGYDLHARNDEEAGPVAALAGWGRRNWHAIVRRYLDLGVPRAKLVMAVPYFGYEWPTETDAPGARTRGAGQTILNVAADTTFLSTRRKVGALEAARHGLRRDPASGTPYYAYRDSTGWHQGWFEDAESLTAKYAFVRAERLGGVALFALGYGDASLAALLREVRAP